MLRTGATQRAAAVAALTLAFFLPLLGSVLAQNPVQPSLSLQTDTSSLMLGPDQVGIVRVTATNLGQTDATLTFSAAAPRGWTVSSGVASAPLAAGRSLVVEVSVGAASADAAPANGSLDLTGRLTNAANQFDEERAAVALGYVAPAAPPPPPPPANPWPWILGTSGAILLVAAGAYVAQSFLVQLSAPETSATVTKGTHSHYAVSVRNRSPFTQTVQLRIQGIHRPWAAAFNVPYVRLAPGETVVCPVSIKPPFEAPDDHEIQFQVQARPNRYALWLVRRPLSARVARKERIVPEPEAVPMAPLLVP